MKNVHRILFFVMLLIPVAIQAEGWKNVVPGYAFTFPQDHGAHPDYPLEWWYVTGHLYNSEGKHFGFQFTIFRVGIHSEEQKGSAWHPRGIFIGHAAISNTEEGSFRFCESVTRGSHGQAGAHSDYLKTYVPLQAIEYSGSGAMTLAFECKGMALRLLLHPQKPLVLQGEGGYSQKGKEPGNASYYTSFTRMKASGTLNHLPLEGYAWYDHEVLSASVADRTSAWDWFSIQLEDNTELMVYRLRGEDGETSPYSAGVIVDSDGISTVLQHTDVRFTPKRYWTSEDAKVRYPVAWELQVPTQDLSLVVDATLDHQELRTERSTGKRYWEGACKVKGLKNGVSIAGMAFVELVGYDYKRRAYE